MRIVVHGQQAFGKAVLEALLKRGDDVVAVYVAPEKEGAKADPLKEAALAAKLPVHQPASYRKPEVWEEFKALKASPAGQSLEELAVFAWPSAPDFGRCWSAVEGRMQIAVQARLAGFNALPASPGRRELQPCVVLRWGGDDPELADDDRRR